MLYFVHMDVCVWLRVGVGGYTHARCQCDTEPSTCQARLPT